MDVSLDVTLDVSLDVTLDVSLDVPLDDVTPVDFKCLSTHAHLSAVVC